MISVPAIEPLGINAVPFVAAVDRPALGSPSLISFLALFSAPETVEPDTNAARAAELAGDEGSDAPASAACSEPVQLPFTLKRSDRSNTVRRRPAEDSIGPSLAVPPIQTLALRFPLPVTVSPATVSDFTRQDLSFSEAQPVAIEIRLIPKPDVVLDDRPLGPPAESKRRIPPIYSTNRPVIGLPETGGRGSVLGGGLEGSNVDIVKEFTTLIIYQRGYKASAQVIVTAGEISQETINLKR